jgi:hypothetical protein
LNEVFQPAAESRLGALSKGPVFASDLISMHQIAETFSKPGFQHHQTVNPS